jgi:hypothetical protein
MASIYYGIGLHSPHTQRKLEAARGNAGDYVLMAFILLSLWSQLS